MHTDLRSLAHPLLVSDCPLCDATATFDADAGALTCEACGVRLDVADDPAPALAAAA